MQPTPPAPEPRSSRLLVWADWLLLIGLLLAALTLVDGLGILTIFLFPVCLYLSWMLYVAAWNPREPQPGWRWLLVPLSTIGACVVLGVMVQGGYIRSALVCGGELLLALAWRYRRGRPLRLVGGAAVGAWLLAAGIGLTRGDLFRAAREDNLLFVQTLLTFGADPNQRHEQQPVLYEALSYRARPALIAALLRHGADPNGRWLREDGSLVQPVAFAFPSGARGAPASEVLRLLLAAGLNPCLADQHQRTFRDELASAEYDYTPADAAALAAAEAQFGCK